MDRRVFLFGLALWALTLPAGWAWWRAAHRQPPLPTLGATPDFSLLDQAGETVVMADLLDQVTVVDFVFTRCPSLCPALTAKMKALAADLPDEAGALPIRFLSVSVDPEHDTPEVLHAYVEEHAIDPARWTFLTGSRPAIEALLAGLGQSAEVASRGTDEEPPDIRHSGRFLLIDRYAMVRGIYDGDAEGLARLRRDARRLAREEAGLPPGGRGVATLADGERPVLE